MKVLLAFDSFKDCMSAREASEAAREGVLHAFAGAETICVPMSDGGDGLVSVLASCSDYVRHSAYVCGPLGERVEAEFLVSGDGRDAVIEMAQASGLELLPAARRNPELTTTYGVGELIREAVGLGCRRIFVGLGGSATCDCGLGMLQALGANITCHTAEPGIPLCGINLPGIESIDLSALRTLLSQVEIYAAVDVSNPLIGEHGAAFVYAPQKGADRRMVERLDIGLEHILSIARTSDGPGDGAAGGMGFALRHFLGARIISGAELVFQASGFEVKLRGSDVVLTGEGSADSQTAEGKVASRVLERALELNIPVLLFAGRVHDSISLQKSGFSRVVSINDGCSLPYSQLILASVAKENLKNAVSRSMEDFFRVRNKTAEQSV